MLLFAYYLLKVSLVSGLLYAYYLLALRNKKFHQYNRFYLLLTVFLSLIIPLLKIRFWRETVQQEMPAIRLLKVVAMRDAVVEQSLTSVITSWLLNNVFLVAFSLVSVTFLALLIAGIIRIIILIRSNPNKSWNNVNFIFTEAKGTPFSFFKYIFWNKNTDLQTEEGKQILEHELTHVQEKHSADKLFLHIALIIGWPNPFFWIIRKELNIIHEFIADEKAISDGDVSTFSAMLLKTVYPQHAFTTLANSFFHSPIKRRLIMFTTSKKPSYSYLRRLMILPILSFVTVFFSFKINGQTSKLSNHSVKESAQKRVMVINQNNQDKRIDTATKTTDNDVHPDIKMNKKVVHIKLDYVDTPALLNILYVIDGVQMSSKDFDLKNFETEKIKEINVLKDKAAIEKYGEKGANGVIEVTTKNFVDKEAKEIPQDTAKPKFNKVFTKVENPPYYAQGMAAFANYIQSNLQYPKEAIENKKEGAVSIQFIVDEEGKLSDFKKVSDVGSGLEEEAIRLLKNSTDWKPGTQNGHKVPVQIVQQITFRLPLKTP